MLGANSTMGGLIIGKFKVVESPKWQLLTTAPSRLLRQGLGAVREPVEHLKH
jgi:hypothetical protein